MLIGSCKSVKKGSLTTILITYKSEFENSVFGKDYFIFLWSFCLLTRAFFLYSINFCYFNLLCIIKTQSKLIAMDPDLYRISHRCIFYYFKLSTRDYAHIEEMLPCGTLASYYIYSGFLANL